ncbi:MAG: sigma-54-dependent transcriptional regulator [Planctomycetota bacterium]
MSQKAYDILLVDDEQSMREFLEIVLVNEGYSVCCAESGEEALKILADQGARVFLQDLRMGGLDGMELLQQARKVAPETPVLVMTAYSTSDIAMEAMRQGGFDFLRKPFQNDEVKGAVSRALASTTRDENRTHNLRQRMVGNTPVMRDLFEMVESVAPTDSTVLVTGESGCGKELIARAIHDGSARNQQQFIAVNCSAFTEGLLESELFGHVKGAFTGAVEERKGVFLSANGGTLFLDEVADMSLSTQVRILRALEDRRVIPVGGDREVETDVRIIAATNKDLAEEVREGRFP